MGAGQDWHSKKHGNNIDAMGELGTIPITRSQDTVEKVGGFVVLLATEIGVRSKKRARYVLGGTKRLDTFL
ncbi:hypothetical protein LTR56_014852 [Elasticomyces elasticus]|nr:hypothetical protein LTR56_014852 [Elasticomyces elasticus]KAK3644690.1 hypothetical protein LTR22_015065 [Elasticomyces elasticus]KAK4916075.1 hypothetical protein LTR49_015849 [Elasticomyces elasticus]KAK5699285.1 hypothetical protein LTR17_023378 [Elasticomyces elasticus]KAK5755186.1 hypothetical protein LTS12_014750 [Elasticomyces elasticus]